jgi:hypothetical protein
MDQKISRYSAVSFWLVLDPCPHPSCSFGDFIEVAPVRPASFFQSGVTPAPICPSFFRSIVHVGKPKSVVMFSHFCVGSVRGLADFVTIGSGGYSGSLHWLTWAVDSSTPAVVETSVPVGMDGGPRIVVKRPHDRLRVHDAEDGKFIPAVGVSSVGVATSAGHLTNPVVADDWELGGLPG